MTKLPTFSPSFTAIVHSSRSSIVQQSGAAISHTRKVPASKRRATITLSTTGASRSLAQVRSEPFSEIWFTAAFPTRTAAGRGQDEVVVALANSPGPGNRKDHKAPDERTLKLGKTLRALSPLLPSILTTPLPNDLLSPNITLHLFPSTHPHLPVVRGRVPYQAALWTSPVAWGSVPIVGNVKLEIQSEKMVRTGLVSAPISQVAGKDEAMGEEKLVVRWRTENKSTSGSNGSSSNTTMRSATSLSSASETGGINRGLSKLLGGDQPLFKSTSSEPFTGLFVFSFDQTGKIASMTIEHADESHGCDKTSRMVTLTDWLLGRAKWGRAKEEEVLIPGLAMTSDPHSRRLQWLRGSHNQCKGG